MSNGGLLQKALEQQESQKNVDGSELLDKIPMREKGQGEIKNAQVEPSSLSFIPSSEKIPSSSKDISIKKIFLALGIGGLLPTILIMWFGIYLIPNAVPITIVTPLVTLASLFGVWIYLDIGLPVKFKIGKINGSGVAVVPAIIVAISYLSMLLLPIILGVLFVGDMSIGEVQMSNDDTELEIKIRQNGGSSSAVDALVEVGPWTQTLPLKIDKSDGLGDYGKLTIKISDIYTVNSLPDTEYLLRITVSGNVMSTILDGNYLSRTIDDVQSLASAVLSDSDDNCDSTNDCVVGVSLTAWAGLNSNDRPVSLPLADYNLSATLFFENGNIAIDYPDVSVEKAIATWDSNSGDYGSGQYDMGDVGSELPLEGSVVDPGLGGFKYIPKDQWEETDFGCYYFVVDVTQSEPWSQANQVISHTSYYIYAQEEVQDDPDNPATGGGGGGGSQETWTAAESC
jgi:hypothetical protein